MVGKTCTLKWIPAHVRINQNEAAKELTEEVRKLSSDKSDLLILDDANAIGRHRLEEKSLEMKNQTCEINVNREITKTVAILRTPH